MRIIPFTIILVFINLSLLDAQESDSVNTYYSDYSQYMRINAFGAKKSNTITIDDDDSKTKLEYVPNQNMSFGLSFNYKWIGFAFSKSLFPQKDVNKYGTSKSFDIGITLTPKDWITNIYLSSTNGLYLKNTKDVVSNWNHQYYHFMDSLKITSTGLNMLHTLNDKFSFKAVYNYNQLQRKSVGTALLGGFTSIYGIETEESMIPDEVKDDMPRIDSLRSLFLTSSGISGGYTYTFVVREKYFVNLFLVTHLGVQLVGVSGQDGFDLNPKIKIHPAIGNQIRLAVGYNTYKWFYGMRFSVRSYNIKGLSDSSISNNYNTFIMYLGRRFGSKKNPIKP